MPSGVGNETIYFFLDKEWNFWSFRFLTMTTAQHSHAPAATVIPLLDNEVNVL